MTFQQLQYLLEVQKANSISKAAENLFVSASSVSGCVNEIEKELGFSVFVRNQKGMVPTAKGSTVLEYADRILKAHGRMLKLQEDSSIQLRVGGGSYYPICHAFSQVAQEYWDNKDISFSIAGFSQEGTLQKIASGELDVSVISQFTPSQHMLEEKLESYDLEWTILREVPYSICVGPSHRLYDRETVSTQDLEQEVLLDSSGKIYGKTFLGRLVRINRDKLLSTSSELARRELLLCGLGYSVQLLPPPIDQQAHSPLRFIPLEGVSANMNLVTNPRAPYNELVERFRVLVTEELQKV